MIKQKIIPAIIPKDLADITAFWSDLATATELHIDICDGTFVPQQSAFTTVTGVSELAPLLTTKAVEVDLMVTSPLALAKAYVANGADRIVFHQASLQVAELAAFVAETKATIGLAVRIDTPLSVIEPYISEVDFIQVMSISTIGVQGGAFTPESHFLVTALEQTFPMIELSVDGGLNNATLGQVVTWPVSRLVVGSAIYQASNRAEMYQQLTRVISSTGESHR
jgi:ribulose-phosphate 3-epimerase